MPSFSVSKPSHACVFQGLPKPGGLLPPTSEISHIPSSENLMKESVRLQLGRACLYAGFWSIIAQALCHLPAYITHPSSRDVVFLFYFSGDFYPSKLSSYHIHIFFPSEIHPCPFQTSTNKLPKQCQSKWWQLKISITSEASLRWEVKEFKQSSNVLYIFCIAAVGLKLRQSISLHHPLETVKAAKQTGRTNPAKALLWLLITV